MSQTSQMSPNVGGGPVPQVGDVQRFEGGQSLMKGAGAVGLIGVLATLAGTALDARAALVGAATAGQQGSRPLDEGARS